MRNRTVEFENFVASNSADYVTSFAPHEALKLIASGKLSSDERVVALRAVVNWIHPEYGTARVPVEAKFVCR